VLYMLYNNMISVTNTWVGQGKLSPGIGLWGIHFAMLAVTLLMFYRRMTLFTLRGALAKRLPNIEGPSPSYSRSDGGGERATSLSTKEERSEESR
jgi:hypothetical protein